MPLSRPALTALRQRVLADVVAAVPGADGLLRHSALGALADAQAGLAHLIYGHIGNAVQQFLPDAAITVYLDRWADLYGTSRKPATRAAGPVTVTGTTGAEVPAGTVLQTADQVQVRVATGATLAAGTATVAVEAVALGAAGNAGAGTALSFVALLPGVDAAATVAAGGLAGGAETETDDALRARLLARLRLTPQGGAPRDWLAWALAVPGVTRAWLYPRELGEGTVTLRCMMDQVRAAWSGIPQGGGAPAYSGDLAMIHAAIDPLRPVCGLGWFVAAPVAVPLDITIAGLSPDTPAVRAAVAAELADLLFRAAVPAGMAWDEDQGAAVAVGDIAVSWIWEAVSIATGERRHRITAPTGDVSHATGQIAVLGTVSYV